MLIMAATLAEMTKFDTDLGAATVAGDGALQATHWQQSTE